MSVDSNGLTDPARPYEVVMKGPNIGQPGTAAIIVQHPQHGKIALTEVYVAMMDGSVIGTIAEAVMQRVMPELIGVLREAGCLPAAYTEATDEEVLEDVATVA